MMKNQLAKQFEGLTLATRGVKPARKIVSMPKKGS